MAAQVPVTDALAAMSLHQLQELDALLAGAIAVHEVAAGHGLGARADLVADEDGVTLGAHILPQDEETAEVST